MTRHKTRTPGIYYRLDAQNRRRYIVWYADETGTGRTITLPLGSTERDAIEKQAEIRGKKSRGEKTSPQNVTFEELALEWLDTFSAHASPDSVKNYRNILRGVLIPRFGTWRVRDITVDDVAAMVAQLTRDGLKPGTVRAYLTPLSRVMSIAVRRGITPTNPVAALERSERPRGKQRTMRVLTPEEIDLLLEAASPRWRPLLTTLVFTGMRISEALSLHWRAVDFEAGVVRVEKTKTEAGVREIVLIPSLARLLREVKLASKWSQDDDLVFPNAKGGQLTRSSVSELALQAAIEKSGIEGHVTLHELRHTFASILIGQGLDVTMVADQMGHSSPAITLQTYAKLFDPVGRRDEARQRLEDAFGKRVASGQTTV